MKKMKKLLTLMLIASMLLVTACSNDENNANNNSTNNETDLSDGSTEGTVPEPLDLDYSTGLDTNGYFENIVASDLVDLKEYNNIMVPSTIHAVTDEDVADEVKALMNNFAGTNEIMDRAIVDGDTVNIDFVGSVDGVDFEGGSTGGTGADVTIGVTAYIDDFLAQLIGHMPGESFDIEVTFPEDYGNEELNGKEAVFAITVNYIGETVIPTLDDAFVAENITAITGSTTVAELNVFIKNDMQESSIETYVQSYLANDVIVVTIPAGVLEYQKTVMINYYMSSAQSYGMTIEEFLAASGQYDSVDALVADSMDQLNSMAKLSIVNQAIAEEANLAVTDEMLSAYFAEYSGSDDYSQFEEQYGIAYLKHTVLQQAALDYVLEMAQLEK